MDLPGPGHCRPTQGAVWGAAPAGTKSRPPAPAASDHRSLWNVTWLGTGSARGAVMHPMWLINTRVGTKHRGALSGLVEWPPKHPG